MADRPSKKSAALKGRNDNRKNGKAPKKGRVRHQKTRLSELEKALMGGGAMKRIARPLPGAEKPSKSLAEVVLGR